MSPKDLQKINMLTMIIYTPKYIKSNINCAVDTLLLSLKDDIFIQHLYKLHNPSL
ncbi:Hypothetical protein ORPV_21 [Orpheovirus IHUMI-LCC2]|uniref:Uncharacterized protein n=1 Tax=Orpheovirus IHUMI-LCC2 TaxID=2023057 RepID=A0A2I2L306_9VIRU|nr:Hypothetical protein ORPV_21 [Orpheovirus IHUMI-LCC2]SNW61925.1 Hypothetical protein ORPV_21 [Orpheovirus IHUMI-LCC2]